MLRRRRNQAPERQPHPDPRIEAQLQRILGLRVIIAHKESLLAEYLAVMASARKQQEKAGSSFRSTDGGTLNAGDYAQAMKAQEDRIAAAQAAMTAAEEAIMARQAEMNDLLAGLSDVDVACL